MKIYTKKGDTGMTSLGDGSHVSKASLQVDAMGHIDELVAFIGLARAAMSDSLLAPLSDSIVRIQNELSRLCSQLSGIKGDKITLIGDEQINKLEKEIDEMESILPPLKTFILPGDEELAARLHVARSVCRRTERVVLNLAQHETLESAIITYLNRLSDWLFVAARYAAAQKNGRETTWQAK